MPALVVVLLKRCPLSGDTVSQTRRQTDRQRDVTQGYRLCYD